MTYDFLLQPFEGLVITEVDNFKEKRLVTPEGREGEKDFFLNLLVHAGN